MCCYSQIFQLTLLFCELVHALFTFVCFAHFVFFIICSFHILVISLLTVQVKCKKIYMFVSSYMAMKVLTESNVSMYCKFLGDH